MQDISETDFIAGDTVLETGNAPRRIDILTSIDGVDYSSAGLNRIIVEVSEMRIPVIGLQDLVRNRRENGTTKDYADADMFQSRLNMGS